MAAHTPSWVETGSNLDNLYAHARKDAVELAECRNRFFQHATSAYLRGDKALASRMSAQARQLDSQMRESHIAASSVILQSRKSDELTLDVHGLHGDEAITALDTRLATLSIQRKGHTLIVIAGAGNHSSARGIAYRPLKDVLRDHLSARGYTWTPCYGKGREGSFAVRIK